MNIAATRITAWDGVERRPGHFVLRDFGNDSCDTAMVVCDTTVGIYVIDFWSLNRWSQLKL